MSYSNSPGFLYYDTSGDNGGGDNGGNSGAGANESSGYLEFDNRSPQKNFSPSYSSSPSNFNRGGRYRGRNKFQGISGRGRYNKNDSFGDGRRYGGNNSFGDSPNYRNRSDRRSYNKSGHDEDFYDISNYINPSMVQDPWKELEAALMNKQTRETEKT